MCLYLSAGLLDSEDIHLRTTLAAILRQPI